MATWNGWQQRLLSAIGAPASKSNLTFLDAWARAEGGNASFNPMNTTQPFSGAGNYNSVGVKNYPSAAAGIEATKQTLLNGHYNDIVSLMRRGSALPSQMATAVAKSPWGTGGGVLRVLGSAPAAYSPSSAKATPMAVPNSAGGGLSPSPNPQLNALLAQMMLGQDVAMTQPGANPLQASQDLLSLALMRNQLGAAQSVYGPAKAPTEAVPSETLHGNPGSQAGGFLGKGFSYQSGRHDQGHDFQTDPGAPIVAPGAGVVLSVKSDPNGFGPAYPVVHFTSGPYAGHDIYIGHTLSVLRPGQRFQPGQVISHTGTHPVGNAQVPGWAEIGYAPGGIPGSFGQNVPF